MRNILLFIQRYFDFLFFLLLQVISLTFLFRFNKFHEAAFMNVSLETTGWVSSRYDNVESYFTLRKTNEELSLKNEELQNKLKENYFKIDTGAMQVNDRELSDTLQKYKQYVWRSAKVVNNSIGLQNNFITIHRGEKQGVKKDMGVISASGIVGSVISTSENYAVVMSLLHRQSRVSARIKKTGELGIIQWDGESPLYLKMINVPKSVNINLGDTIVTSQYSYLFPKGIMVGTVAEVINDKASNFYTLKMSPSTDFFKLEYVMVVENLQKDEQLKLEESTKKSQ
jgi:rod shape-determining protein MreC